MTLKCVKGGETMDKKKIAISSFILSAGLILSACGADYDNSKQKKSVKEECKEELTELSNGGYKCEKTHGSGIPMWYFMGKSYTNESSYNSAVSSYKNSSSQSKKDAGISESKNSSSNSSANKSNTSSSKNSIGTGGSNRGSSSGG